MKRKISTALFSKSAYLIHMPEFGRREEKAKDFL